MDEGEPNDSNSGIDNDIQESLDSLPVEDTSDYKSEPAVDRHPVDSYTFPTEFHSKPKKSNKKTIIAALLALVVLVSVSAIWYLTQNKGFNNKAQKSNSSKVNKPAIKETDPQLVKFITPTTGEVWLDKAVALSKQGYFKASGDDGETNAKYYKVGTRGGSQIIKVTIPTYFSGDAVYLFEQSNSGVITYIGRPDANAVYNSDYDKYLSDILASKVSIDNNTRYDSLSIPNQIKINDSGSVVMAPTYPSVGQPYVQRDKTDSFQEYTVKQLGKSTVLKSENTSQDTGLVSVSYYMKTPLNTTITLRYEPLDVSLDKYQWSSGYSASDSLKAITHGCGSLTASVTKTNSISADDVEEIGKSAKGLTVYAIKDSNNILVQKAYQEFKDFYQSDETNYLRNISLEDFMKYHALVIYKDVNGDWLVYIRTQFAPMGGCAKPVVYLYPTSSQYVNVKVGADVKISDPYYNQNTGWTALAKPNGNLVVNGRNYSSLFWEGPGFGEYPNITSGTIVKQGDLLSTISKQLKQQGLNDTESGDFMDYWQGKLPTQPYVRLTWFTTAQMDKLAPLHITPKPDTVIRVFLDAKGMDKPISIPTQSLKSIPRKGFTVVEWGGLPGFRLY